MTVIGVDAHKRSHTMVAVDAGGRKLGIKTVAATPEGHFAALRWARDTYGIDLLWGVEDTRATTASLERDLTDAGQSVVRVPTQLMARARTSGRERGKSDPIDALAVARAVLANPGLPVARHSRASREIKLLADHREDLLKHRTAVINRLLWRIHELDPTHTVRPTALVQRKNQLEMAQWLAPQPGIVAELARAELTAITTITPDINALERRLTPLVRAVAPELLDVYGCATKTAARIVGEAADISRFRSESAFVRYAGLSPVPHWSGGVHGRLRSHKGGNRRLNSALHQVAMVRIKTGGPWAEEYRRRRESDTHPRVMRRLKRKLARMVYQRLRAGHAGYALTEAITDIDLRSQRWSQHVPTVTVSTPPRGTQRRGQPSPPAVVTDAAIAVLTALNRDWSIALGLEP